jgi:predicted nucleotidyltransferase
MDLTEEQQSAIKGWGQRTAAVAGIILFGSRAKGTSGPNSDVDLALELNDANPFAAFLANGERWQLELRATTGLMVNLESVAGPEAKKVRNYLNECSIELFRR